MFNFFKKIWHWISNKRKKPDYKIKFVPDNPKDEFVKEKIIYIVGNKNYQKWLYFKCPCSCGDVIMLSLNKERFPSWSFDINYKKYISINPSVHRLDRCKSHFWIRNGKVSWVKNSF